MIAFRNTRLVGLLLVTLLISGCGDELLYGFIKKSMKQTFAPPPTAQGRFEVQFCGTGTPRFNEERAQPCLLVVAGDQTLLFDAGQGALWSMEAMGAPWMNVNALFVSHLHSDHISGVGEVVQNGWVAGRRHPIDVFGPPGIQTVINGFNQVYQQDILERLQTYDFEQKKDAADLWGRVEEVAIDDPQAHTVYERNGLVVKAFRVDHPNWQYAYGYRVEYRGKTLVISGDTRPTEAITRHAAGVDLLIHEAYNSDLMDMIARAAGELNLAIDTKTINNIAQVHTDTLSLAKLAEQAGTKKLVLTHMIPPIPPNILAESYFIGGMDELYQGDIQVARDGMKIVMLE